MWTPEQRIKYTKPDKRKRGTAARKRYAKAHYKKNKAAYIHDSWVRQIGLLGCSEAQYYELYIQQHGMCAICKRPPKGRKLAVDHNHKTKIVRGLLCSTCNTSLGGFQDSPEVLEEAKRYLCRGMRSSESSEKEISTPVPNRDPK